MSTLPSGRWPGEKIATLGAGVGVTLIEQWPAHVEAIRANGLTTELPDKRG